MNCLLYALCSHIGVNTIWIVCCMHCVAILHFSYEPGVSLNSLNCIEGKYFALLVWTIDDNFFMLKSVAFIKDSTHNIYAAFFVRPLEVISSLKLEWHKWRHRNFEKTQTDEEIKEHTSIKQPVTVSYEIWQSRNLPTEHLRSCTCFQEELIVKQEEHDITCHAILLAQLSV